MRRGTDRFVEGGKDIFGKVKGIARDKTKGGPTEMLVVAFDGVGQADEVLETLRRLKDDRLVELGKGAVIRRGATVRSTSRRPLTWTPRKVP